MGSQGLSAASRGIAGQRIGILESGTEYRAIGVWLTPYKSVEKLKFDKHHLRLLFYTPLCPLPIWSPACLAFPDYLGGAVIETVPFKLSVHLDIVNIVAADYVNHELCSIDGLSIPLDYGPHEIHSLRFRIPVSHV